MSGMGTDPSGIFDLTGGIVIGLQIPVILLPGGV